MFGTKLWRIPNPHFAFNTFLYKNRAVCAIVWKNIADLDRPKITIKHVNISCWINKSKNTNSKY